MYYLIFRSFSILFSHPLFTSHLIHTSPYSIFLLTLYHIIMDSDYEHKSDIDSDSDSDTDSSSSSPTRLEIHVENDPTASPVSSQIPPDLEDTDEVINRKRREDALGQQHIPSHFIIPFTPHHMSWMDIILIMIRCCMTCV